ILMPIQLPRARRVSEMCLYVPGPWTTTSAAKERRNELHWVNPGIAVRNVVKLDPETGRVDKYCVVTGAEALMYDWPKDPTDAYTVDNWRSGIPEYVIAELYHSVARRMVKNLNTLGFDDGYNAIINAIVIIDMCRDELSGTDVGNLVRKEYPLCFVLPMGSTMLTTTNQGKTNYGRILGGTMVPGIHVDMMNMSSSAPVQREVGGTQERFGTALLDEF